jgi:uncharacterized protein
MKSALNQLKSFSPFLKLMFLLMLIITGMIVISVIGLLIAMPFYGSDVFSILSGDHDLSNPVHIAFLKYMQIISHFAMFIIPALLFAILFEGGARSYFMLKNKTSIPIILIGCFSMVLLLPFVNFLGDINANMKLPEFMHGLEQWMKTSEGAAETMIMTFVSQTEWYAFIVNIFMIAIVPAVSEELIFRGIIQRQFGKWFGNVHVAVIVSAIIFSAIHMQFYGFLPRVFLGIVLGYMFVWTGSLWLPILAHFTNNALATVVAWLHASGYIKQDFESFGNLTEQPWQLFFVSLIACIVLVFLRYLNKKTNPYYYLLKNE